MPDLDEAAEQHIEVLKAQSERQQAQLAARLRLEQAAHASASAALAQLQRTSSTTTEEHGRLRSEHAAVQGDLEAERAHR